MEKKILASVLIIIALVSVFLFISKAITSLTGHAIASEESLAKCLTKKNVELYGAYWCSHCNNQKSLFGDSVKYLDYIECDPEGDNSQASKCMLEGITGYPTWKINGKLYPGEKTLKELSDLSGC